MAGFHAWRAPLIAGLLLGLLLLAGCQSPVQGPTTVTPAASKGGVTAVTTSGAPGATGKDGTPLVGTGTPPRASTGASGTKATSGPSDEPYPTDSYGTTSDPYSSRAPATTRPAPPPGTTSRPAAGASIPVPVLSVGDTWTLRTTTNADGTQRSENLSQTVTALDHMISGGTTYETYRIESDSTDGTAHNVQWERRSDLAQVKTQRTTVTEGATSILETTYDPPCATLPFPLVEGMHWSVTCNGSTHYEMVTASKNTNSTSPQTFRIDGDVGAFTTLTVPAGSFTVAPITINQTSGGSSGRATEAYAQSACSPVRISPLDVPYKVVIELISYKCAKA